MNITRQDEKDLLADAVKLASEQRDNAEVGALLAKCEFASIFRNANKGWASFAKVAGFAGSPSGYGTTQLAAIRAAVEAAEKGVRE